MENEGDFSRLEKVVEKLLANFDEMKQDNHDLQQKLLQKEQENKMLLEEMTRLKSDKDTIHKRVTGLLGAIEKWESSSVEDVGELSFTGEQL